MSHRLCYYKYRGKINQVQEQKRRLVQLNQRQKRTVRFLENRKIFSTTTKELCQWASQAKESIIESVKVLRVCVMHSHEVRETMLNRMETLTCILAHENREVRLEAAQILIEMACDDSVSGTMAPLVVPVINSLLNKDDPEMAELYFTALGHITKCIEGGQKIE